MELSQKCRVCLSESEFNVSLFGSYSRKTGLLDKILVCLKIAIEENEMMNTICYKCAGNIESYYDFVMRVKKCQMKLPEVRQVEPSVKRHVTSYVREQVFDADYTFSFLDPPEEKKLKTLRPSSPFFSYFSQPKGETWKTPRAEKKKKHLSRDLFESQSQEVEDNEPRSLNWKLTPDDNILKRVRDKCFGRSDF